jgi:four helix bundle protein
MFRQLARSATSPAANYAEAREAVSSRDYVHRMKIVVKELRETITWLEMLRGRGLPARATSRYSSANAES